MFKTTRLTLRFGYSKHSITELSEWQLERLIACRQRQSRDLLEATRRLLAQARAILRKAPVATPCPAENRSIIARRRRP